MTHSLHYAAALARPAQVLGIGPARSGVELSAGVLHVRVGWLFRARVPVTDIQAATRVERPATARRCARRSRGWPPVAAVDGIVELGLTPRTTRIRLAGLSLPGPTVLQLHLQDPDRFLTALRAATDPA